MHRLKGHSDILEMDFDRKTSRKPKILKASEFWMYPDFDFCHRPFVSGHVSGPYGNPVIVPFIVRTGFRSSFLPKHVIEKLGLVAVPQKDGPPEYRALLTFGTSESPFQMDLLFFEGEDLGKGTIGMDVLDPKHVELTLNGKKSYLRFCGHS